MRSSASRLCLALIALSPLTNRLSALTFAQFVQCVGSNGQGSVCQLDTGQYAVSSTILIGRSNITLKGTMNTSVANTTLQRAPGFTNALIRDLFSLIPSTDQPNLRSVTIQDLTIDGNRSQNLASFTSYAPELQIFGIASVLMSNCNFINSPRFSVGLYGAGTSGVVINKVTFLNNVGAFWSGPTGNHNGEDYTSCPNNVLADDVIVANSRFDGADLNALYASITNLQLIGNTFTNTYNYPLGGFPPAGGQIDLDPCVDNAAVVGNVFEGGTKPAGAGNTQGIELHGTNISVVNNSITNNWHDGISIGGAANIFIANWDGRVMSGNFAGVSIHQLAATDPSGFDSRRPVDFVTIDSVRIVGNNASGVWANNSVQPVNHLAITNSCISLNASPQINLSHLGPDVLIANNQTANCTAK